MWQVILYLINRARLYTYNTRETPKVLKAYPKMGTLYGNSSHPNQYKKTITLHPLNMNGK